MAHTPGPWTACDGGTLRIEDMPSTIPSHVKRVTTDDQGRRVHQFIASCNQLAEQVANAHLIAAAPDLLAVLKRVDEYVSGGECCPICAQYPHHGFCSMKVAIAKAEGRS